MLSKWAVVAMVTAVLLFGAEPIEGVWRRGGLRWDIKRAGNRLEVKVTALGGNSYSYSGAADGKENPVIGFLPGTTVRITGFTPRSFEVVMFRNGKEFSRTASVVSPDGKLLNSETTAQGSSSKMVWAHY
ncbi:MAG: hypothetical protein M3Z09_04615 [Acidobacteriota bacterium]|nr:hypothetical protein [Acidobacteriota bacterium]